ncbi:MAG: hypothetical protein ACOYXA_04030 [Bacteroidota bacterium]
MIGNIMRGWHFERLLRLGLGVLAIGAGVAKGDVLIGGIGGLLLFQALANISCCGSACAVPRKEVTAGEVEFDEVKKEK